MWQRGISRMGLSPAMAGLSRPSRYALCRVVGAPTTPAAPERRGFGLCPGRSPLLGVSLLFSLPAGTKMFQFPALAPPHSAAVPPLQGGGLSHSDTCGSMAGCASPQIFAASRVLHRLLEPRHPPCALIHFLPLREKPGRDSRRLLLGSRRSNFLFLLAVLSQNVKERMPKTKRATWRITDSNR